MGPSQVNTKGIKKKKRKISELDSDCIPCGIVRVLNLLGKVFSSKYSYKWVLTSVSKETHCSRDG